MVESHSEKHYTVCGNCGQRALTVATRCPHCSHPFEAHFYQRTATAPRSRRVPVGLIAAALVITVVVANALRRHLTSGRPVTTAGPVVPAPPPRPRVDLPVLVAESIAAAPAATLTAPSDSTPPAQVVADSAAARADGVTSPPGSRRYASTWMHVRAGRSGTAPVVRVLRPGEAVQVDSLRRGWYRLVAGEEPLGYVDGGLLDSVPPDESP